MSFAKEEEEENKIKCLAFLQKGSPWGKLKPGTTEPGTTESGFNAVNDGLAGAYLLWGNFEIELTAGTHTITHTADENAKSYIHWRAIYLSKVAEATP